MRKTRRKRSRSRRRRKRGGACGCPLANTSTPLPYPAFEPPGGMYVPGATNGLDGGYYYGVNVDQSLPDPISSQPLMPGVQMGGRRHRRRTRRKHRRRTKRKRRRRKRKRKTRRRRRRRKQRGGGWSRITPKEFLFNLVPKDILDAGFQAGHKVGGLYRGYVGERPKISPAAIVQPIDQNMRTLSYKPINSDKAYADSITAVNNNNTISAQAGYQ